MVDQKVGEKDARLREDVEEVDGVHGVLNVDDYCCKVAPVFWQRHQ
jgi:peptide chain release factor 3